MTLLSDDQIESRLEGMDGWDREGDFLHRELRFDDFAGSVAFVNRILPVAEEMNHHPDLEISWNRVSVSLSTHSRGGITDSDFRLAGEIDALA